MINIKELENAIIARENAAIAKIAKRTAVIEKTKELFFQAVAMTVLTIIVGTLFVFVYKSGYNC